MKAINQAKSSPLEKCPSMESFWSVFSRIQTEQGDLSVFSPNAGKYRPKKLRIWTLFTHFLAPISKEEVKIIMGSSKSLLLSNTFVWIKREEKPDFDVTMCRFDPVEICELGLKILVDHKLKRLELRCY